VNPSCRIFWSNGRRDSPGFLVPILFSAFVSHCMYHFLQYDTSYVYFSTPQTMGPALRLGPAAATSCAWSPPRVSWGALVLLSSSAWAAFGSPSSPISPFITPQICSAKMLPTEWIASWRFSPSLIMRFKFSQHWFHRQGCLARTWREPGALRMATSGANSWSAAASIACR